MDDLDSGSPGEGYEILKDGPWKGQWFPVSHISQQPEPGCDYDWPTGSSFIHVIYMRTAAGCTYSTT